MSESSPLTESAKTGEPIFLEGERFRHEAHAGPWHLTPHCAAAAVLPLVAEGQVWGVISVSYAHDHDRSPGDQTQFDAETRGFTMAVAQHCAQALERARLYEAEQRARTDAEAARAEAESANAAKSEFLAAMSHEIRTPINAIQGYAQLLELGLVGPVTEQQRICLGRLSSSTQHLLGLVDDVLDLAKVDAGQMHIARESAPIARAIATALDLTRPLAAARGIGVSDLTPTDAKLEYQGDEHRVRQILVNLLSNAIKFTSSGGTVSITAGVEYEVPPAARVRGSGPWVFSRVADTGIGIPPREHSHVFDAFHQVERGTTRTRGGTGLGLTISRRLARLMDGDVTLESAPGVGSTFTLWLPATSRTVGRTTAATPQASDLHTPGLRELGDLLRLRAPRIVEVFVDRVRADPMIAEARRVRGSQLEDHLGSILMDFAQSLIIVGDAGLDAATLLRDGTAIQRAVGEQHGARRHAQGWRFSALRREQEILREAIAEAVHAEGARARAGPGDATAVLFHLIDRSAAISLRAWQRAADRGVSESADIVAADAPEIPAAWPGQPSDRTTERQTSPPGHDQEVPQSAERDQLG